VNDQEVFRGQFRFDKRFIEDPNCAAAILVSWNGFLDNQSSSVMLRLVECRKAISQWKRENDFNAKSRITKLRRELDKEKSATFPSWTQISLLQDVLGDAYREEEDFWRLKSRDKWMVGGDKNSKFFQATVKANRVSNSLRFLVDENGNEQTVNREKGKIAVTFFEDLFSSSYPSSMDSVLEGFNKRVTEDMNQDLTKKVNEQEIYKAVFSINAESAPGPDGFTALFFQRQWPLVKNQIISDIELFFQTGILPEDWNHTHLCLIPKITKPARMADIRPISLCSVMYKIISKILSARLKKYLPVIVSPTQSAFVAERLVSDNIILAHEIVHNLRTNEKISKDFMVFKTDMSKAYDRVEWPFLKGILLALGFNSTWINWMMACVSSVSYSVLINGQPFGHITPHRGLRQGDPLSPFLFVLCTEALIHILNQAEKIGKISGIQFNGTGPSVNHLLFADDTLLICKASQLECAEIMHCLSQYGHISGQMINSEKSAITFGAKVNEETKQWIMNRSGIQTEGGTGKYLGLPECFQGSKQVLFGFIKEKLQSRLSGWYAKTLSQGGKDILLKSIAMAFPVYAMTCFRLSKTLCTKLTSVMMDFWWNSVQDKKKIHWIGAQKLMLPKFLGGFGFKDLQCFNQALLAKQASRLHTDSDSLLSQILKSRYYMNSDFLSATKGTRPSYAWQSILYGRELLVSGLKKIIGNGENTYVWMDNWIFDDKPRRPESLQIMVDIQLKVSQLIDPFSRNWNLNMLRDLFPWKEIQIICQQRPMASRQDSFCWFGTNHGLYTVKSEYDLCSRQVHKQMFKEAEEQPSLNPLFGKIWNLNSAPKIKVFLWKVLKGAVAVEDRLRTRGVLIEDGCSMCPEKNETLNHILFQCPLARQVWALTPMQSPNHGFGDSIFTNVNHVIGNCHNTELSPHLRYVSPWIIWILWKNRNKRLFEGIGSVSLSIVGKALEDCKEWLKAHELICSKEPTKDLTWIPPLMNELKCNIGIAWSKKHQMAGVSWVVRNWKGRVLLHSRCSFSQISSHFDAKIKGWNYAVESMDQFKFDRVTFGASTHDIIKAMHKPNQWPALRAQIDDLLMRAKDKELWFMAMEPHHCNEGASEIAKSVITGMRWQSYVASGYPRWLQNFFEAEGNLSR